MAEDGQQSVWNVDAAQFYVIFQIKTEASVFLTNWQLVDAYWRLRDLRREIDAKFNRTKKTKYKIREDDKLVDRELTEKEMVDYLLDELTKEKDIFESSGKINEDYSRFYLILEEFYMKLSEIMKEHGIYLREGEEGSDAFRRR